MVSSSASPEEAGPARRGEKRRMRGGAAASLVRFFCRYVRRSGIVCTADSFLALFPFLSLLLVHQELFIMGGYVSRNLFLCVVGELVLWACSVDEMKYVLHIFVGGIMRG